MALSQRLQLWWPPEGLTKPATLTPHVRLECQLCILRKPNDCPVPPQSSPATSADASSKHATCHEA